VQADGVAVGDPPREGPLVKDPGGTDSIVLKHKIRHLTSVHSIRDPRIFHKGLAAVSNACA
jgi:hypothetical protein